jgi:TRAP-type C4-dicarboxylate transport system permease small subunit
MNRFVATFDRLLAVLAALAMVAAFVTVALGVIARLAAWDLPGLDAYAGYAIAAALFLALPQTLRRQEHIRVTLLLGRLKGRARIWAEVFCLAVASFLTSYFAWFSINLAWGSYRYDDISQNVDATPLWIPQIAMALGVTALALAFIEELIFVLRTGHLPPQQNAEIARTE